MLMIELEWAADMHKAGVPVSVIAEKLHVDRSTLYHAWLRKGINARNRNVRYFGEKSVAPKYSIGKYKKEQTEIVHDLQALLDITFNRLQERIKQEEE